MVDRDNRAGHADTFVIVTSRSNRPVDIHGDSSQKVFGASGAVWNRAERLAGPTYNMGSRIRDLINECVTEFVAQYYKDNP